MRPRRKSRRTSRGTWLSSAFNCATVSAFCKSWMAVIFFASAAAEDVVVVEEEEEVEEAPRAVFEVEEEGEE